MNKTLQYHQRKIWLKSYRKRRFKFLEARLTCHGAVPKKTLCGTVTRRTIKSFQAMWSRNNQRRRTQKFKLAGLNSRGNPYKNLAAYRNWQRFAEQEGLRRGDGKESG